MTSDPVRTVTVAQAHSIASEAAASARVSIRPLTTPDDAQTMRGVLNDVFGIKPGENEASVDLLLAMAHAGQYLVLAEDRDGQAIGISMGFFWAPAHRTLHSHATAVLPLSAGRRVGRAIKTHQRAWALARDVDTVTWTYDPLVRRNAWFNLARLGARVESFKADFYGAIPDFVNDGDESDRFVVAWDLAGERVASACAGRSVEKPVDRLLADGVPLLLAVGDGDRPVRTFPAGDVRAGLIQVPADVERMRVRDRALAAQWRIELRAALTGAFERGLRVSGVGRDGWYVLEAEPADGATRTAAPGARM